MKRVFCRFVGHLVILLFLALVWASAQATTSEPLKTAKSTSVDENDVPWAASLQPELVKLNGGGHTIRPNVLFATSGGTVLPMPCFHVESVKLRPKGTRSGVPLFGPDGHTVSIPAKGDLLLDVALIDVERSPELTDDLRAELLRVSGKTKVAFPQVRDEFRFALAVGDADDSNVRHELGAGTFRRRLGQDRILLSVPLRYEDLRWLSDAHRDRFALAVSGSYRALFTTDDLRVSATSVQRALANIDSKLQSKPGERITLVSGGGGSAKARDRMRKALSSELSVVVTVREGANVPPEMIQSVIDVAMKDAIESKRLADLDADGIVALAIGSLPPVTLPLAKLQEMAKGTKTARMKHAAELVESAIQRAASLGLSSSFSYLGIGGSGSLDKAESRAEAHKRAVEETVQTLDELHEAFKGERPQFTAMSLDVAKGIDLTRRAEFTATFGPHRHGQKGLQFELSLQAMAAAERDKAAAATQAALRQKEAIDRAKDASLRADQLRKDQAQTVSSIASAKARLAKEQKEKEEAETTLASSRDRFDQVKAHENWVYHHIYLEHLGWIRQRMPHLLSPDGTESYHHEWADRKQRYLNAKAAREVAQTALQQGQTRFDAAAERVAKTMAELRTSERRIVEILAQLKRLGTD